MDFISKFIGRFISEFFMVLGETIIDVLPIVTILVFFQFAILRRPLPRVVEKDGGNAN